MSSVYHSGELAVQQLAGEARSAEMNGKIIRDWIPAVAASFLQNQSMAIVGSLDEQRRVWCSLVTGPIGFIQVPDEHTVLIQQSPANDSPDPLFRNVRHNREVGMLAIELKNRRRMRVNGTAQLTGAGLLISPEQVYANCPKYIQARVPLAQELRGSTSAMVERGRALTMSQMEWVRRADTFFIASASAEDKVDASHRGGSPGFIRVDSPTHLVFPDYFGNSMFNTLGNIHANPRSGLLFMDFQTTDTLQITGRAQIIWDPVEKAKFPGAERLVSFEVEEVIQSKNDRPAEWQLNSYSPFNPE